jgi:hypothetical protein
LSVERTRRNLTRMRVVVLGALLFLVAACAGPHWVGDAVEQVDGYWVLGARSCTDAGCTAAKRAALLAIGDPDGSTVTAVWDAQWTDAYVDELGHTILRTISPPIGLDFFVEILDLKDGSRRIVPIACSYESGAPVADHWNDCGPDGGIDHSYNQVGNEPWLRGSGG